MLVNWDDAFRSHSDEEMWVTLRDTLTDLVVKYVPVKTVHIGSRKRQRLSKKTLRQMKWRNKQWKKYRLYPTAKNYDMYKKARNSVNSLVREDRSIHQYKVIQSFKGNPRKFYAYMRKAQTVKAEVQQLEDKTGELTTTHHESARVLCETFQKCFVKEQYVASDEPDTQHMGQEQNDNLTVVFSETKVKEKLVQLKPIKRKGQIEFIRWCSGNVQLI